jgi:hypothetical protein
MAVPDEALSTRFGGDGAVVFFGLAQPVRTPLIGPVQSLVESRVGLRPLAMPLGSGQSPVRGSQ